MKKLVFLFLAALWCGRTHVLAFGAEGHALVGAIADARLAGTPAGSKVTELLDGLSLARAAVIPDEIKGWDKHGAGAPGGFYLPEHPAIEKQLREFWLANPPSPSPRSKDDSDPVPSHHWFHYTNIPLRGHTRYDQGKQGRSKWDIVHMISYCQDVLAGRVPEDNPRKITKAVSIILLAHYVGDLHQPLHVGAEFFDRQGRPVDPDAFGVHDALESQGGNTLFLILKQPADPANPQKRVTLHGYWDRFAPMAAIARVGAEIVRENPGRAAEFLPAEIAAQLVAAEPADWNLAAGKDPSHWAELWATAILPVAREAHDRLHYSGVRPSEDRGVTLASGFAREKSMPDGKSYVEWSGEVIAGQIAKGGWRLAALLEKSLSE
jgi:hypothetical protein